MRTIPTLIVVVLLFCAFGFLKYQQAKDYHANVWVEDTYIYTELAVTDYKRAQGLSEKNSLKNGEGMLFVFEKESQHIMWMKDMDFAIDIIWINNGKVVDIAPSVEPEPEVSLDKIKKYIPRLGAKVVLEVPAGFAMANKWKIGDEVVIEFEK